MSVKTEQIARTESRCLGCGEEKQPGLIVCWSCFKHRVIPFKSFDGTLEQWLTVIGKMQ